MKPIMIEEQLPEKQKKFHKPMKKTKLIVSIDRQVDALRKYLDKGNTTIV